MSEKKIVSLSDKRKKKQEEQIRDCILAPNPSVDITIATDIILTGFEVGVSTGTLNEFIAEFLSIKKRDWENSLDDVDVLMQQFGLKKFIVHAPDTTGFNPLGWLCAFYLSDDIVNMSNDNDDWDEMFSCPQVETENQCRILSTLLYVEYCKILRQKYGS